MADLGRLGSEGGEELLDLLRLADGRVVVEGLSVQDWKGRRENVASDSED